MLYLRYSRYATYKIYIFFFRVVSDGDMPLADEKNGEYINKAMLNIVKNNMRGTRQEAISTLLWGKICELSFLNQILRYCCVY